MKYRAMHQQNVDEFMRRAGQELPETPRIPSEEVRLLRAKLILEEAFETVEALGFRICLEFDKSRWLGDVDLHLDSRIGGGKIQPNLVEIADGCADLSVVTVGTLSACGISAMPIQALVDASNLAKFGGDAHRRDDGKWVKPSDWIAPPIAEELKRQGWQE